MLYIENFCSDPRFNIASEEFLLKNFDEDILMIWRSNNSVIIGKHQLAIAEADIHYLFQNNIPLIRRISGGGTVFHDPGNINFTIILNKSKPEINFAEHSKPIIEFLQGLGLNAAFEGKNDVRIDNLKVSGNAAHLFKNKILYHGTLLYNSKLSTLKASIKPTNAIIETKAIQSNRSRVANISELMMDEISIEEFQNLLKEFLFREYSITSVKRFSAFEKDAISELVDIKYNMDDWNYCYSPDYRFKKSFSLKENKGGFEIDVSKGIIKSIEIASGSNFSDGFKHFLLSLREIKHIPTEIKKQIETSAVFKDSASIFDSNEYLKSFF
ncbi:MAG: lipoate--protein ligase family protein [Bacteroidota bacterium]